MRHRLVSFALVLLPVIVEAQADEVAPVETPTEVLAPVEAPADEVAAVETPVAVAPPPPSHAPRMASVTLGYAWTPKNDLPLSATDGTYRPMGFALEGRYGWQVGGLDGSRPSWVGLSASVFAHTRGSPRASYGIDYGLFVRHALTRSTVARPFLGYGLGATQVFVRDVGGRGIGHLTTLSVGVDVHLRASMHATFEIAYRFVIVPSLETELEPARRYDFHALRFVAGLHFGR